MVRLCVKVHCITVIGLRRLAVVVAANVAPIVTFASFTLSEFAWVLPSEHLHGSKNRPSLWARPLLRLLSQVKALECKLEMPGQRRFGGCMPIMRTR